MKVLLSGYLAVCIFFILRLLAGFRQAAGLAVRHGYTRYRGCKVITHPQLPGSFSIFNYIFLAVGNDAPAREKELILEHELAHVVQRHWVDLLGVQLSCALQWWNPFAWLYVRAVKENHEFLADRTVIEKGNPVALYRAALINHSLKVPVFVFASPFTADGSLKRIQMMTKAKSSPFKKGLVLGVVPVIFLCLMAFAKPRYTLVTETHLPGPAGSPAVPFRITDAIGLTTRVSPEPLLLVNGVERHISLAALRQYDNIESVTVRKDRNAILRYGQKGKDGVVEVVLRKKE